MQWALTSDADAGRKIDFSQWMTWNEAVDRESQWAYEVYQLGLAQEMEILGMSGES